ncbi:major capsid protein [Pedobacter punctiformis]|uniref:Major capsid protein n=1 Tax=Pedobacter punctiformis TaxID=3004097 RepID=A0ABT4LAP9_9SPHI|nr:major capsid protein [Pedobacter sp. HCMS5-2]MCZ4244973.1 major capsid protein [Pedobacter sp. HCMS5-2]
MEPSLFTAWVAKYFKPLVAKVVEKINGTKTPATYLHKTMLRKEYSPTLKWNSINVEGSTVAADVVAMDSPLPLKKRDSISKADGDIPKLGMKLALNERTMTDLDILSNSPGNQESSIVQKLFQDTAKAITGIYEVLEMMFLQALSSGVTLIADTANVGLGIRIDFGYKAENKFGVSVVWSAGATGTPISDFNRVKDKADADGNSITTVMMDQFAFNNMLKSTELKQAYAGSLGIAVNTTSVLPTPNMEQATSFILGQFGWTLKIVNRTVRIERDGVKTNVKPWQEGSVVFLTSEEVGSLTWGTLAEMNHPNKAVTYQTADQFILVSKYHKVDPLKEYTSSQALALPVINNVDEIYQLDTKTVQA